MTNELTITDETTQQFDLVVKKCSDIFGREGIKSIKDSFVVLQGIKYLKEFFAKPEIKELVIFAQDNVAGFLTDRNPAAIRKHNKNPNKKYTLEAYSYSQVLNAIIPLMLEGYALHGNEMNIISGQGYRGKRGKYQRILSLTKGFQENISTPAIKDGFAFFNCRAKWAVDSGEQSLGFSENDACHIKIPYVEKRYDTIDKVLGKAQSKLYTCVLTRITGSFISDDPEMKDITPQDEEKTPKSPPTPPPRKVKQPSSKAPIDAKKLPAVQELIDALADEANSEAISAAKAARMFGQDEINHAIEANSEAEAQSILNDIEAHKNPEIKEAVDGLSLPDKPMVAVQQLFTAMQDSCNKKAIAYISRHDKTGLPPIEDAVINNQGAMASRWQIAIREFNENPQDK